MPSLPHRPRLADFVRARWQLGEVKAEVLLHDIRHGTVLAIAPAQWDVLRAADGTRDVTGVALAARAGGLDIDEEAVLGLLTPLADLGLLVDGVRSPTEHEPEARPPAERPVTHLPGFRLICDGSGGCCRRFGSILFTPLESARARAIAPERADGGLDPSRAFTPERGGRAPLLVVARRGDACVYLDDDASCALHARGGREAKPFGCRTFPFRAVDDGREVRIHATPVCPCVLASRGATEGEAPFAVERADELPAALHVEALPESIAIDSHTRIDRAFYLSREARLFDVDEAGDLAGWCWEMAERLERAGVDAERARGCAPPRFETLRGSLSSMGERLASALEHESSFRSANELPRRELTDAVRACESILGAGVIPGAIDPAAERFHFELLAFGHHFALERSMVHALRALSLRVAVARAWADEEPHRALAAMEAIGGAHLS